MHFKKLVFILILIFGFSFPLIGVKEVRAAVTVDQIVNEYPDIATVPSSPEIQTIRDKVNKLLQDSKHRDYPGAILADDLDKLMWFKGMEVWTLAETLPLLDDTTRNNLKTFLQYEVNNYLLSNTYRDFENQGDMATKIPSAKMNWNHSYDVHPTGAPAWETLYGLWAYAHYTDDWPTIQNNWNTISSIYSNVQPDPKKLLGGRTMSQYNADALNSEIAGRIAYMRIAKKLYRLTNNTIYQTAYQNALTPFSTRIATLSNEINQGPLDGQVCGWYQTTGCGVFERNHILNLSQFDFLAPELGRWLKENYATQSAAVVSAAETKYPWWFMGSYNIIQMQGGSGGEGYFEPPLFAYQMFQAKAQILGTPVADLQKQMPWVNEFASVPNYWDILNYANNLTLIKREGSVAWTDTNTPPSIPQTGTPTPAPTPVPCTINSVAWPSGVTSVTEGSNVNISVTASGSCSGRSVHLTTRKNITLQPDVDAVNQPLPRDVTLTLGANNTATASAIWKADTWTNACLIGSCDPTYFAKGNLVGDSVEVTTDRSHDLTVTQSITIPTSPTDWPQVQKDAAHTGYSAETLGTNIKLVIRYNFQPDRVYPQVQAIVYRGKVLVGTEGADGQKPTIYAIDAINPDPANPGDQRNPGGGRVIWKFEVGGPILNSVAADNGMVYSGSMDGTVYAVYSDTENGHQQGALAWKQQISNRHGFSTAPIIAEGKVLIGGRDGYFYALDAGSGQILWRYNVGKPIYQTAAYDQGKVFFGAMDMSVYALNTSPSNPTDPSTILAWKSPKILGMAFKDYWPVITQGKVFIRPVANVVNGGITSGGAFGWGDNWNWLATWGSVVATGGASLVPDIMNAQDAVMNNYQTTPNNYAKNLFILDENTGQEAMVVPHWTDQTMNGATALSCVDKEGKLIVPLQFIRSGWGRLDLNIGRITDILYDGYDQSGQPFSSTSGYYPAGMGNNDENYAVSCAQNYVLAKHVNESQGGAGYTGAFNLDNRRWIGIGTETSMPKQMSHNTQGGGTNPYSISNGRLYGIVFHTLLIRTTN